jgi:hypothetical protein
LKAGRTECQVVLPVIHEKKNRTGFDESTEGHGCVIKTRTILFKHFYCKMTKNKSKTFRIIIYMFDIDIGIIEYMIQMYVTKQLLRYMTTESRGK